ncbi:MAG: hypothetical protein ABIP50_01685 [Candidatus Saccharimonadales bacterium]
MVKTSAIPTLENNIGAHSDTLALAVVAIILAAVSLIPCAFLYILRFIDGSTHTLGYEFIIPSGIGIILMATLAPLIWIVALALAIASMVRSQARCRTIVISSIAIAIVVFGLGATVLFFLGTYLGNSIPDQH